MKLFQKPITILPLSLLTLILGGFLLTNSFSNPGEEFVPDQLLVKFYSDVSLDRIHVINSMVGGTIKSEFRLDSDLFLIKLPEGADLDKTINDYLSFTEVKYAEKDTIYKLVYIPNDTDFSKLWGMHNTGQTGGVVDADIDAPEAWDNFTGSPDIVIASIDTGINRNHPDLDANIWTNPNEIAGNGKDDDNNGYIDDTWGWNFVHNNNNPADDNSHGSHTCGTMAGEGNNNQGVAGVIWTAQLMGVKVCTSGGSCPSSNCINGIDYATENGAWLSNNSWGGGGYNQSLKDAIERANQAGSLFVAAAGNNGRNTDASPFYPASYDNENILSVAATDHSDNKSSFSNYGLTSVDVGAPGSSIYSTTLGTSYGHKSGTSMAAPHGAGVCAFVWSYNPNLTHLEVKQIVMDSARPIPALDGRCITGGVVNAAEAFNQTPPPVCPNDPNQIPIADPAGPYRGPMGKKIKFNASGSFDPDGTVKQYIWDFGDGTILTTTDPITIYFYSTEDIYTVTLTVKDDCGDESAPAYTTCRVKGGKGRVK